MSLRAKTPTKSAAPTFNSIFLNAVRKRGRMNEAGLMASFKLRTGRLFEDMGKLPMMLLKGKMPLWQPAAKGRGEREELFDRAAKAAKGEKQ
jgi:heterodisulfide reductase subunit C